MKELDHKNLWLRSQVAKGDDDARAALLSELARILDHLPQMVWASLPCHPPLEYYNRHWQAFTGESLSSDGSTRRDLIHPEDRADAVAKWERARKSVEPYQAQYRIRHHAGGYRWILSRGDPHKDEAGQLICWYGTCTDVHEQVLVQKALETSEAFNRSIIQASADCIKLVDRSGSIIFMNNAALREHGFDHLEGGIQWSETLPAEAKASAARALAEALQGVDGRFTTARFLEGGEARWRDYILSPVAGLGAEVHQVVISSRDVTQERLVQEQLRWASNHDGLTKLPNRSYFDECVHEAIRQCRGTSGRVGLLIVDVDHLKEINDALGHDAGDRLLTVFAERLVGSLGKHDVVGRLGGDEFGVLLFDIDGPQDMTAIAARLLQTLREPFSYAGHLMDCRASIGGSIYPDQGPHKAELMKAADLALYSAKRAGRLQAVMFEPSMRAEMQTRASMLSVTKDVLRHGRVYPYYQPKLDLRSGAVVGFEALLRWQDANGRVHLPGTISAAFDDKELAPALTDAITAAVIADAQKWTSQGLAFGHIAINASAPDFRDGAFADRLLNHITGAGLPPSTIQLEVTETVFLGRGAECVELALRTLNLAGMKIALDDFGTGFASLSHLKRFPVDVLKIDQSFVRDLESDPEDAAIIRAVINLARSLNIEVVAEGIETANQLRFLIEQGCDVGQGHLFNSAVPADRVPSLIAATVNGRQLNAQLASSAA